MLDDGITVLVPLSTRNFRGEFALIDIEDADRVLQFNWTKHSGGYAYRMLDRTCILMHRFVLSLPPARNQLVDHVNRNKLDNRRSNLRLGDKSLNAANSKMRSDNTSGFRGVSYRSDTGKWVVQLGAKAKFRAEYSTAEEAALAYDVVARERWGEFAHLNFPLTKDS